MLLYTKPKIASPLKSTDELLSRLMYACYQWRVQKSVASALCIPELHHEIGKLHQIFRLVRHHKFLILKAKGVDEQLFDIEELLAKFDVLVHHSLTCIQAHQIPFLRLAEWIDHKVFGSNALERIDVLFALSF